MVRRTLISPIVILCAFAGPQHQITDRDYRVYHADGSAATLEDVVRAAQIAEVAFLGESHDDPVAHYLESEILKRVAGPDWALSMEMFERDVQPVVDEYLKGLIEQRDLIASGRAWNNYRSDYAPLVDIAKDRHMAVIAANAPKRYVDIVSKKGQAALQELSPEAKETLPPLPYAAPSEAYRQRFEREMNEAMGKAKQPPKPGSKPEGSHASDHALESQSLWDASMAESIARFLKQHPGEHVLEINGAFHSEFHQGIVEQLERYRPGTRSMVITIMRDKPFPSWKADMKDAGDFVIVTDPRVKAPPLKKN